MALARLRKVGGSVMVALPPSALEAARLTVDAEVDVSVDESGAIRLRPTRKSYTLDELLEGYTQGERSAEDDAWLGDGPVGRELI